MGYHFCSCQQLAHLWGLFFSQIQSRAIKRGLPWSASTDRVGEYSLLKSPCPVATPQSNWASVPWDALSYLQSLWTPGQLDKAMASTGQYPCWIFLWSQNEWPHKIKSIAVWSFTQSNAQCKADLSGVIIASWLYTERQKTVCITPAIIYIYGKILYPYITYTHNLSQSLSNTMQIWSLSTEKIQLFQLSRAKC